MRIPENHILIIFGASGDLTKRKLLPALFELYGQGLLPRQFAILGVGRTTLTDESFRQKMAAALESETHTSNEVNIFLQSLYYISIDTSNAADYAILREKLLTIGATHDIPSNYLYYLATPPSLYSVIPRCLSIHGLATSPAAGTWRRLIIEKPFGTSLETARQLNQQLLDYCQEGSIYRIDHYLGKETVQNILVTRFSNGLFEPLWNRNYIHHVEISSVENIGVEDRGGYYDHSGALRDMVQNHLLQLVALTAMEPPAVNDSEAIRNEMLKVFQSIRPLTPDSIRYNVLRGQYTASTIKEGKVPAYRQENGVLPESKTETFVAMKMFIDNWRWAGVPFLIRTGKRLPTRVTEIVIHFRSIPHHLFSAIAGTATANQLILRIQPDEGILLKLGMKVPGAGFQVQNINLDFHYSELGNIRLPSAYGRLLHDCMLGDSTLYTRGDAIESAWQFVQPILDAWQTDASIPLYGYPAGTWGPPEAESLMDEPGFSWRYPCKNLANDGEFCEL